MGIITISRGTFSGGQSLAECVADKLGYRCISREVLLEASRQYGVDQETLFEALTKKPGFLERLSVKRIHYLAYIRASLFKEARDDNLVYHGHAGHLLLRDVPHVLRVRIIANMEFRIQGAMDLHHMSEGEAKRFITKVDDERVKWTRFLYQTDWHDPSLYDVDINLDHLSLADACDMLCHMADMERYQRTPQSQKLMDDLVLANHLMAVIAADESIPDEGVEIASDEGVVTISGTVESLADADKIKTVVGSVSDVKGVNSEMRVRLAGVTTSNT